MKLPIKKDTIKWIAVVICILFFLKGHEVGDLWHESSTELVLFGILYILFLLLLLRVFKGNAKADNLKVRIFALALLAVITFFPAYLTSGALNYLDYYGSNKRWTVFDGEIKSGDGRQGHYSYLIADADTSLLLRSRLYYKPGHKIKFKFSKTFLGRTIAHVVHEKQRTTSVFIKLWLDNKHSTINHYFAFVVN